LKYRAEIDGLRALAVIPVILFHAGFELFRGGFVGVDVFFVISGYLIATILVQDIEGGQFSILRFYERRARRILPALFFVMLACFPAAWFWLSPRDFKDFGQSLIAVSLFSSNFLFWLESGYFSTAAEFKPLLHTWSLAVEEQYYILFPLFLALTWRLGLRRVSLILFALFATSLLVAHWGAYRHPSATFFLLPTRGWELLLGVFVALLMKNQSLVLSPAVNQFLSLLGLTSVLLAFFLFDQKTPFPSFYALIPTVGTALLLLCAVPKTLAYRLLSDRSLVGIGLVSYSAYLWHQPIIAFYRHRFSEDLSFLVGSLVLLLSLAIAYVSWRWIESPFRSSSIIGLRGVLGFSLAGIFLFTIAGATVYSSNGFPSRVQSNPDIQGGDVGHDEFHAYVYEKFQECEQPRLRQNAHVWEGLLRCQKTESGKPSVALFGDSHAEHLFLGLAEQLDENVIYLIKGGYAFVDEDSHRHLIQYINATQTIKKVVYSIHWWRAYEKYGDSIFREKLSATLEALSRSNREVIVVADVPDFISDSYNCKYSMGFWAYDTACRLSRTEFERQRAYFPSLLEVGEDVGVDVVDPSSLFCGSAGCNMIKDGIIMYRDNDHLNIPASILVGRYVVEKSDLL